MPRLSNQLKILRAPKLDAVPWLVHGFSTRPGGVSRAYGGHALNLGFSKDDARDAVEHNRAAFVNALWHGRPSQPAMAVPHLALVGLRQVHSDLIHYLDAAPHEAPAGDGLITAAPGLLLTIKTADCLPVLLADTKHCAVGAFHAGWRGTLKRIVEKGVGEMQRTFGSKPRDLLAAIGPGIRRCCYQVGEEVQEQFASQFAYADELFEVHRAESDVVHERYPLLFLTARAPGHSDLGRKILLDLVVANRRQLLDAGVPEHNITVLEFCTACRSDLFFSYRREGPTGRMMAAIGLRSAAPLSASQRR